jgi:hypothetical protein
MILMRKEFCNIAVTFQPDTSGDIVVPHSVGGARKRYSPEMIELIEGRFSKSFPDGYARALKLANLNIA